MALLVRAEHTTSWSNPASTDASTAPHRIVHPARAGDAHLVGDQGRSLCGRDGSRWKLVTSRSWLELGDYRCVACLRRLGQLVEARRTRDEGPPNALQPTQPT